MFKKLINQFRTKDLSKFPSELKCVVSMINHKGATEPFMAQCERQGGRAKHTVGFQFEYPYQLRTIQGILDDLILEMKGMDRPVAPIEYTQVDNTTLEITFNKTHRMGDGPQRVYESFMKRSVSSLRFA